MGAAAGLAVAGTIAHRAGISAASAAITLLTSGTAFYFEIDHPSVLGSRWFWSGALALWGVYEWRWPRTGDRRADARGARAARS